MEQSFTAGYMIRLDKTFEFHETKFYRVVWALVQYSKNQFSPVLQIKPCISPDIPAILSHQWCVYIEPTYQKTSLNIG